MTCFLSAAGATGRIARPFDQLHPVRRGHVVEADFGRTPRELDGAENAPIGLRAKVRLERRLGFPPLDEHDGLLRALLLVDVAGGAAGLGQHRPLDGPEDLEHLGTSVRCRQDPECSDDHVVVVLLDSCRAGSRPGVARPNSLARRELGVSLPHRCDEPGAASAKDDMSTRRRHFVLPSHLRILRRSRPEFAAAADHSVPRPGPLMRLGHRPAALRPRHRFCKRTNVGSRDLPNRPRGLTRKSRVREDRGHGRPSGRGGAQDETRETQGRAGCRGSGCLAGRGGVFQVASAGPAAGGRRACRALDRTVLPIPEPDYPHEHRARRPQGHAAAALRGEGARRARRTCSSSSSTTWASACRARSAGRSTCRPSTAWRARGCATTSSTRRRSARRRARRCSAAATTT